MSTKVGRSSARLANWSIWLPPQRLSAASVSPRYLHGRQLNTEATLSPRKTAASSQWPLTVAVSLLTFVIGLGVESRREKTLSDEGPLKALRSELNQLSADVRAFANDTTKSASRNDVDEKDEPSQSPGENEKSNPENTVEQGKVHDWARDTTLPELDSEDADGWREAAETLSEKLRMVIEDEMAIRQDLAETEDARRGQASAAHSSEADSQTNAVMFLESLLAGGHKGRMLLDDDILRVYPFEPPEDLFEGPVKPLVVRILDEEDRTSCVLIQLDGEVPSGDEMQSSEQWRFVKNWSSNVFRSMQQAGQISHRSFWNLLWSKGWFTCGLEMWKQADHSGDYPLKDVQSLTSGMRTTSEQDLSRYRILDDPNNVEPATQSLGNCRAHGILYPGMQDEDGEPRKASVLVDTGAEMTFLSQKCIPNGVPVMRVPSINATGFGGGEQDMNGRVQLRLRLHSGDDPEQGIDIQTTAYVVNDRDDSMPSVVLGTDTLKPLGAVVDVHRGLLRVHRRNGTATEIPIYFRHERGKVKEPSPQVQEPPQQESESGSDGVSASNVENPPASTEQPP